MLAVVDVPLFPGHLTPPLPGVHVQPVRGAHQLVQKCLVVIEDLHILLWLLEHEELYGEGDARHGHVPSVPVGEPDLP